MVLGFELRDQQLIIKPGISGSIRNGIPFDVPLGFDFLQFRSLFLTCGHVD